VDDLSIREKARRRHERLMREDPEFRAYVQWQAKAMERALKRPLSWKTRYALEHLWKGGG
jgi:hypothetical protein